MQFEIFEKQIYENRRDALKKSVGSGIILLMGNEEASMNYRDNWYPFRQDSTFLYFFGLNTPGLAAIIDVEKNEEIIFGNELTIDDILWTGPLPPLVELTEQVGVLFTRPFHKISSIIESAIVFGRKVHFLPPYRPENKIRLSDWLKIPIDQLEGSASLTLIKAIIGQRSYKQECEIREMDNAVNITADMHLAAMSFAKPGMKEYEVVAKVKEVAQAANASMAYRVILTTEGQTLHTNYYGNTIRDGQMILCDAGAENCMHYAGDLTSTFPVGNKFSTRQKDIYQIVLDAHETALSMLRPGVLFKDVYLKACEQLVDGLIALDLMHGNSKEAVNAGAHAMFFQCGLGHMIGLDVHDMEDLGENFVGYTDTLFKSTEFGMKSLRMARALEANFTITVEPGIYIIPELIDRWKAENKFREFINYKTLETYRDFTGIRVEENVLITENGYRLLGKKLPKTINELEKIRQY